MQQNVNLNLILDQVAKDKGIDRPKLVEILEEAIASAAKRHFGMERNLKARYDEDKGQVDLFQVLTIVADPTEEAPIPDPVNMVPVVDRAREGDRGRARRRARLPHLLPARGRGRGAGAGRAVGRPAQAQDLPPLVRPHRRADREAGDDPGHAQRRARERLQRVQGPQGRGHHRHRPPLRARQRHRRPRPRRGGAAGPRAGAARELPRRRPDPGVRDGRAPRVEGAADHPLPRLGGPPEEALRDGGPGDRRGRRRHRGGGPRAGRPRRRSRSARATRTSTRSAPASA